MSTEQRPCGSCPFRADHQPGTFGIDRYERLRATIGSPGREVRIGEPMFACHNSFEGEESVCAGWLVIHGYFHLGVRVAVTADRMEFPHPDETWPELTKEGYDEMVARIAGPEGACRIPAKRRDERP